MSKRWHAYVTPGRNSIAIGRDGSDKCPILIDGRHLLKPDVFARRLVRLLNAWGCPADHPDFPWPQPP